MHIAIPILLVIAGIAIIAIVRSQLIKRNERKRQAAAAKPHVEWAQKVLAAGSDERIVSYTRPDHVRGTKYPSVVSEAVQSWNEASDRLMKRRQRAQTVAEYEAALSREQLTDRVKKLRIVLYSKTHLDVETCKRLERDCSEAAQEYAGNLLESARAGFRDKFLKLVAFVIPTYPSEVIDYHAMTSERYVVPSDWDELVVRYYKTPSLGDFKFRYCSESPGDLRLLAVRALDEQSLLLAQVVLAHYDSRSRNGERWRQEIGEHLMTDLGKLVDHQHAEQRLTFA